MILPQIQTIIQFFKANKLLMGGSAALVLLWLAGPQFAINTSASLPKGFYLITKYKADEIKKGDMVMFYNKKINSFAYKRGYVKDGEPIGKRVAAVEGDLIDVDSNKVIILGKGISEKAPVQDSKGRKMELFSYKGAVPKNNYFLIGDVRNSFDSRYYGFVNKNDITAIITPFIVW